MRKSTKLHAKDGVGSNAIKRMNNLVCVSRHRLHLNKKTHVWVVNSQPMVHIFCRDMKFDLFTDGQFGRIGIPPPLTDVIFTTIASSPAYVCGHSRREMTDKITPKTIITQIKRVRILGAPASGSDPVVGKIARRIRTSVTAMITNVIAKIVSCIRGPPIWLAVSPIQYALHLYI